MTTATPTVFIDNDRVRVTEWRFAPGTETGHHRHEYDYVVVPIAGGRLLIRNADGEGPAQLVKGQPYFREAGVEHNVINDDTHEIVFIELEMK